MNWKEANNTRVVLNKATYLEVADSLGIPVEKVEEIVKAQSELIFKVIKTGALESVALPYLGKIRANPRKAQKVNSMKTGSTIKKNQ